MGWRDSWGGMLEGNFCMLLLGQGGRIRSRTPRLRARKVAECVEAAMILLLGVDSFFNTIKFWISFVIPGKYKDRHLKILNTFF